VNISGNTFLITGGASGLGEACARQLHARGSNVVIADVAVSAGESLAAGLDARTLFVRTDVTDEISVRATLQKAIVSFGSLQGVINCAGILGASRVLGKEGPHDLALFRRVIEINLIGTFNVCRLAAEVMSTGEPNADGERGVLINTSSVSATDGQIGQSAYAASKGGVASLSLPMARELALFGIRVVAIAPGVFETPMMAAMPEAARAALAANVPFPPRLGKPAEFAALAEHILENPMLNGTIVRLDGALRMPAK
jgi:NAD(P)-dependent dehydrogenase (short-subunit alcohol dehydrogenase family)